MQMDTAMVKSIINHEGSGQNPLYESYGPNTNLLQKQVIIAKGGQIKGIVPSRTEFDKPKIIYDQGNVDQSPIQRSQHLIK